MILPINIGINIPAECRQWREIAVGYVSVNVYAFPECTFISPYMWICMRYVNHADASDYIHTAHGDIYKCMDELHLEWILSYIRCVSRAIYVCLLLSMYLTTPMHDMQNARDYLKQRYTL